MMNAFFGVKGSGEFQSSMVLNLIWIEKKMGGRYCFFLIFKPSFNEKIMRREEEFPIIFPCAVLT
jgi:hypothetical protein